MNRQRALIVWDSLDEPSEGAGEVYAWTGYSDRGGAKSLFAYVEKHAEGLRSRYLAWIYDLGETAIFGKPLIEWLAFEDGLSFWWLSLSVAQNRYLSPGIDDAIRLLALDEIISTGNFTSIRLVGGDQMLDETLRDLACRLKMNYDRQPGPRPARPRQNPRSFYRRLPLALQAAGSFIKHVTSAWQLRHARPAKWFSGDKSMLLCSYFIYLDPQAAEAGHFKSRYWTGLDGLASELGLSINWLHLYQPGDVVPNRRAASKWTSGFNRAKEREGAHALAESYLTLEALWRILRRWVKLMFLSLRLRGVEEAFRLKGAGIWLWPALRRDWFDSMRGPTAIGGLMALELFDRALMDIPKQEKGLFLYENQSWERAFSHAWKKHGHGELIGVAHSTIRFWDLRYFSDPRFQKVRLFFPRPEPDSIAVNGTAALDALRNERSRARLLESEALRYGFLNCRVRRLARTPDNQGLRVLVLSDYVPSCTAKMLELLEEAATLLTIPATFILKPHPKCRVDPMDYPRLKLRQYDGQPSTPFHDFDCAFASNLTSASVDARLSGLPVAIMLDENELNFSPLRGYPGVHFVSTARELAAALEAIQQPAMKSEAGDFFFLDPELPRWRRLLSQRSPRLA